MNRRRRLSGRGTVGKANKGGKEKEDGKAEERRREKREKRGKRSVYRTLLNVMPRGVSPFWELYR